MTIIDKMIAADKECPKRILVIGDCMFDMYVQGRLEPTCQEGCPKFVQESMVTVPGGAANAARSLEHWFARKECLPGKSPSIPHKVRFMVGDKCVWRYDDDRCELDLNMVREWTLQTLESWKPEGVLLSDYDKGLLTPEFMRKVIDWCNSNGVSCVADAKRKPDLYRGAVLKVNSEYSFRHNGSMKFDNLVVTNGDRNPILWNEQGVAWGIGSGLHKVPCINHVGAGDCFAAHLTLALACGFSLKEAAAIAHSAGRVYVQKRHNTPPHPDEIKADMELSVVSV